MTPLEGLGLHIARRSPDCFRGRTKTVRSQKQANQVTEQSPTTRILRAVPPRRPLNGSGGGGRGLSGGSQTKCSFCVQRLR